MIFAVLEED